MQFIDFLSNLNQLLPINSSMKGDKVGLQIRGQKSIIKRALVTLEVNENVIKEAKALNCEIILTFHPLIYTPLQEINYEERVGLLVSQIIKNDIHLYSIHTSFDTHNFGTNSIIANFLDLKNQRFIEKIDNYNDKGIGFIGELNKEMSLEQLIEKCFEIFSSPIKYCFGKKNIIKTIAIIGGSGSSYINSIISENIDCFITSDNSYHNFHKAHGKLNLIDIGHYEMEQFVPRHLARLLQSNIMNGIEFIESKEFTNPVLYFPISNYLEKQQKYLIN
jgi:dinuclear metal center YbgI/SA1388 family protein